MYRDRARFTLTSPSFYVVAFALTACAMLVGTDSWRTWQEHGLIIHTDQADTTNLARSLAQEAHDTILSADAVIIGVREQAEAFSGSTRRLAKLQEMIDSEVGALPNVEAIDVLNSAGRCLLSSGGRLGACTDDHDRRLYDFHESHTDRGVHVGDPVRGDDGGHWFVTVSRRLDDDHGAFAGIVVAKISVDRLQAFYKTFNVGPGGSVALFSTAGIMIARQPPAPSRIGTSFARSTMFRDALPRSPTGSFQYLASTDKVWRVASYRQVEHYPLVVVVSHALADVLASWRLDAFAHCLISLVAAAALLSVSSRFARQVESRQEAERRYRLLADSSSDAIISSDCHGVCEYVSPAFSRLTGWKGADMQHAASGQLVHPKDRSRYLAALGGLCGCDPETTTCFRYQCKDGSYLWVEACMRSVASLSGSGVSIVSNVRDISGRKRVEDELAVLNQKLAHQASTDPLTGLSNRRRLDEAINQECRRAFRDVTELSFVMIDVDYFKAFNDCYGHQEGDACLRIVADIVAALARRPGDVVARYGGEELALLLPATSLTGAAALAKEICEAVRHRGLEHLGNPDAGVVTVSAGVSTFDMQRTDVEASIKDFVGAADAALYKAKRLGRNCAVDENGLQIQWAA